LDSFERENKGKEGILWEILEYM
jgi:hypothetical protein